MPSKAAKKARRRQSVDRSERVGPTPETEAKLKPDPFNVLVQMDLLDSAERDAGLEIRAIWYAVTGGLLVRAGERSSHRSGDGMSDKLAEAHAQVYVPWCDHWGGLVEQVIDLVVDAILPAGVGLNLRSAAALGVEPRREHLGNIPFMLQDYARRRRVMGQRLKAA